MLCESILSGGILTHLNIFEEKKNKQAHPVAVVDHTEPVEIVPYRYDDGWPEYVEAVFER